MNGFLRETRQAIGDCNDTIIDGFNDIRLQKRQFYAQDDADSIAEANYQANKDLVDQQWGFMLDSYNTGVYFNAGMFYARIFNVLVPPVEQPETEENGPLLNRESPKQFSAGFLYGWSGQTLDERDNMVECERNRLNGMRILK